MPNNINIFGNLCLITRLALCSKRTAKPTIKRLYRNNARERVKRNAHDTTCTHACTRGRESSGFTCQTWVHSPLKLLLELRGRLQVSFIRPQKCIACRFTSAERYVVGGNEFRRRLLNGSLKIQVFSGTSDISGIKYVAELLGNLTEMRQEVRRQI